MAKERSLFRAIVTNFVNSLKPRSLKDELVGKDYNGTKYYQSGVKQGTRRIRQPRWFVPVTNDDFQQEIPPEWEAWLRYRRNDPPTEEEVNANYKKMMQTKQNAAALEGEKKLPFHERESINDFPRYDDLEANPGSSLQPPHTDKRYKEK